MSITRKLLIVDTSENLMEVYINSNNKIILNINKDKSDWSVFEFESNNDIDELIKELQLLKNNYKIF
jgi:hypothetical protein